MSVSESPRLSSQQPLLSDRVYTALKYVTTIVLPALGAFYFGLAQIWGLPKAAEVVGSIASVNAFLGVMLGLTTVSYNASGAKYAGSIDTAHDPSTGVMTYSLVVNGHPEDIATMKTATFKINGGQ